MMAPRSDSNPAVISSSASRRSTFSRVVREKSARVSAVPGNRIRFSVAPAKSTSRSRQFSNVTSVSVAPRKFTESSLHSWKTTRRRPESNAWTPAAAQPMNVASSQVLSARSADRNRTSRSHTSLSRLRRMLTSSSAMSENAHSTKRPLSARMAVNAMPVKWQPS